MYFPPCSLADAEVSNKKREVEKGVADLVQKYGSSIDHYMKKELRQFFFVILIFMQ
jgi:hypothetical protein